MNSTNRALAFLAAVLILVPMLTSCFTINTRDDRIDLSAQGFISDDCFQSLLEFPPDPEAQGLVKARESAMKKTESPGLVNWMVLEKLADYRMERLLSASGPGSTVKGTDLNAMKLSLRENLRHLLSHGSVEYTFYREDNSAVLVHRIRRKNLRTRLDEVPVPPEAGKEKH